MYKLLQPPYHFLLACIGALLYRFPSKKIMVIGVTGTKGKSTVTELVAALLKADGKLVASSSTIQFKIGDEVEKNLYKMTMPGRFFIQKFLREAVNAGCTHAVIEMTSEGAKQFRHKFIDLDALIFTNLTPEHIESHGSFEKYKQAKLKIRDALISSSKRPRYLVVNTDDIYGKDFLSVPVEHNLPYGLSSLKLHTLHKDGVGLILKDKDEEITLRVPLVGLFNVYNALAAVTLTHALGVTFKTIESTFRSLPPIRGRVEHIESPKGRDRQVTVIVDYAHTPDSLTQLYTAFKNERKICVLGNTGGGRDKWKRPEMAHIAEQYCEKIILTNEDPYDEDPGEIVDQMAKGIENKEKLSIIMDRREAIRNALESAPHGSYILVSGKGTDPYIMGPEGSKQEWSDSDVVKEEMERVFGA